MRRAGLYGVGAAWMRKVRRAQTATRWKQAAFLCRLVQFDSMAKNSQKTIKEMPAVRSLQKGREDNRSNGMRSRDSTQRKSSSILR